MVCLEISHDSVKCPSVLNLNVPLKIAFARHDCFKSYGDKIWGSRKWVDFKELEFARGWSVASGPAI